MGLSFYHVDAFTDEVFKGNPAAVCPLDDWLPDHVMQKIAAEHNLPETAFFVPVSEGFHLRWFTPSVEVDLCGHATLAAAFVLMNHLGFTEPVARFHTLSGELRVVRKAPNYILDLPSRPALEVADAADVTLSLGATPESVFRARDFMAVFSTEEEIVQLKPDMQKVAALGSFALIATAPGNSSDFVSRFFAPAQGIPEDPVTGSAHCTLVPYWADRLRKNSLFARQLSARTGALHCELKGDRVTVGGAAKLFSRGEISV